MSFISITFAVFFLIFIIFYHLAGHFFPITVLSQKYLLLTASIIFYLFADIRFLPFLLFSIFISYIAGKFCKNKLCFIFFIIADLLPLLFCKYNSYHFIFPLGISFFTFQSISYISDCYKKNNIENNFLNVALFITFFPVISSGPIQRPESLIPQFNKLHHFDYNAATDGLKLFVWGIFQKLCIADRLAQYINYVYENAVDSYGLAILLATTLYSFQIYCDFAGYSNMAIGVAKYCGFDVGKNFNHPYLAKSIGEFWKRWHISLSSWLRDYVYIPLGGSRVPIPRIYLNIVLTFLVSGIWHGSTWNFVIWGLLHGVFQCVGRASKSFWEKVHIPLFIRVIVTFCLVTFAWIFFRTENLQTAGIIIQRITQVPHNIMQFSNLKNELGIVDAIRKLFSLDDSACGGFKGMALMLALLFVFIICDLFTQKIDGYIWIKKKNLIFRWSLYFILLLLIMFFKVSTVSSTFIYNKF